MYLFNNPSAANLASVSDLEEVVREAAAVMSALGVSKPFLQECYGITLSPYAFYSDIAQAVVDAARSTNYDRFALNLYGFLCRCAEEETIGWRIVSGIMDGVNLRWHMDVIVEFCGGL